MHGHPYLVSVAGTWIFNNIITVMISSLAAPTKESSASYVYWFKVLNSITGNLKRAQSTALENSPNWQDAVNAHLQKLWLSRATLGKVRVRVQSKLLMVGIGN